MSVQESRRTEIRGIVRIASDAVGKFWPLRTFVHHNPLIHLESVPFHQAMRQGPQRLGGRGYLSCATWRTYLSSGRIQPAELDRALAALARDDFVEIGDRRISHRDVLRASLLHLTEVENEEAPGVLGADLTLSQWADRALGTDTVQQVNDELIKWCSAFLDEGHATWPMPSREQGFYRSWKALAAREWSPCGIADSNRKIATLPEHAEDCLAQCLRTMGIPFAHWADYLSAHLAALPGWAGFIRWRAEQSDYPWQKACPISLVQYLAVRLWYESELVSQACRSRLGHEGTYEAISASMLKHEERPSGPSNERLMDLARALDLPPRLMQDADPQARAKLSEWLAAFSEPHHGAVWLEAFEATWQRELLGKLVRDLPPPNGDPVRPQTQSIYCIDVRMEPFRRHLEGLGHHETFGFAGFFAAPIRFRAWGAHHDTDQCPAVTRPRNEVRELPRTYRDHVLERHHSRKGILHAAKALVQELKENVVTPFVMVESLGWFYGIPLVARTLWPGPFERLVGWLRRELVPEVATTLTVDKLPEAEIDEMLAAEQRALVWKTLRGRVQMDSSIVEALRQQAIQGDASLNPALVAQGQQLGLTPDVLAAIVSELRDKHGLDERSISHHKERLSRAGFTLDEQVMTVESLLRMIGLTSNFARLVLICGHASRSSNNPYEAALDCGACGGNPGKPNARLFAMMANKAEVRERLRANGIAIPSDTHFLAAQINTTTDRVELFDLEDVPATHRRDVTRFIHDLQEAGMLTSQERFGRLPGGHATIPPERAWHRLEARSVDWSQVRPEWGLSGNAAFIIGPRSLSHGLNLSGRVFMHSYDWRQDPSGRWLEVILTGPQLVCEWIALEHYFSTVDNEVFGSGSKVYHNVVGRLGVLSGPWSDLRIGLSQQTVMQGATPFHEPMRLLTVIDAPRARLDGLIARHELLQHYYRNQWVHLVAIESGHFYRFSPTRGWIGKELAV